MPMMDARSNGRLPLGSQPAQADTGRASSAIAEARKKVAETKKRDEHKARIAATKLPPAADPPAAPADSFEAKPNSPLKSAIKKVFRCL